MTLLRRAQAVLAVLAVGSVGLGLASPAAAYTRPGQTTIVPQTAAGVAKQCCAYGSAISGDGSKVAFQSASSDIVPGETPGSFDTYVRDFSTGVTQRVSVASDGTPSVGGRQYPNILSDVTNLDLSADGRYVAFTSNAANLVAGDTNGTCDVFVHDLATGTTERVSVGTGGAQLADGGLSPSISANGRYVAFSSGGLFVRDRTTGVTERIDVSSNEEPANFYGYGPSVSDDGRWVAFQSSASNLVPDPTEAVYASGAAIYLRDRLAGTTMRVTGPAPDTKANGYSWMPDISGDGRYIAFSSAATDLVPQDTNRADDVFVFDRVSGLTRRMSVASDGAEASPTGSSHAVSISRDGRFVSFTSAATNLVPADTNAVSDVFVHDLLLGTTERVSDGGAADFSALSDNGAYVALESSGTGVQSVQRRLRGAPVGVLTATISGAAQRIDVSGTAGFAGAVVSAADDPAAPAPAVSTPGADVKRVEVAVRPEAEDLRVRIVTPDLPSAAVSGLAGRLACFTAGCPASVTTSPYVGYRVSITSSGVTYRVVVDGAGAAVLQCGAVCTPVGTAVASVGVTGQEVVVSVPLSVLGGARDQAMTSVSVASTLLGSAIGTTQDLDTVTLPNARLAAPQLQLATVPAGRAATAADYTGRASLNGGSFTGSVPVPATASSVWLRACVGTTCGPAVSFSAPS